MNSLSSPQNPYKYAIIKHSIFYSQEAVVVIVGVLIYKASYCDNNVNSDALGWRGGGGDEESISVLSGVVVNQPCV